MKKLLIPALLFALGNANATNVHFPKPVHGSVHTTSTSQQQTQGQNQTLYTSNTGGTGGAGGAGGTGGAGGNGGSSTVNSSGSNNAVTNVSNRTPRQVASAAPIALMPTAVCSGTSGAGAQGAAFGLSFGTSWTDQNCMLLEQVRVVAALDEPEVAQEMLCAIDGYREARIRVGRPCKQASTETKPVKAEQYTDPIIRARLGLPPL